LGMYGHVISVLHNLVIVVVDHRHHRRADTGVGGTEVIEQQAALAYGGHLWSQESLVTVNVPQLFHKILFRSAFAIGNTAIGWIDDHRCAVFAVDFYNLGATVQPEGVVGGCDVAILGWWPVRIAGGIGRFFASGSVLLHGQGFFGAHTSALGKARGAFQRSLGGIAPESLQVRVSIRSAWNGCVLGLCRQAGEADNKGGESVHVRIFLVLVTGLVSVCRRNTAGANLAVLDKYVCY